MTGCGGRLQGSHIVHVGEKDGVTPYVRAGAVRRAPDADESRVAHGGGAEAWPPRPRRRRPPRRRRRRGRAGSALLALSPVEISSSPIVSSPASASTTVPLSPS